MPHLARRLRHGRLAEVVHHPREAGRRERERQRRPAAEHRRPTCRRRRRCAGPAGVNSTRRIGVARAAQGVLRARRSVGVVEHRRRDAPPRHRADVADARAPFESPLQVRLGAVRHPDEGQDLAGAGQATLGHGFLLVRRSANSCQGRRAPRGSYVRISGIRAIRARASARSATSPVVRHCTTALPTAVASTGPATTTLAGGVGQPLHDSRPSGWRPRRRAARAAGAAQQAVELLARARQAARPAIRGWCAPRLPASRPTPRRRVRADRVGGLARLRQLRGVHVEDRRRTQGRPPRQRAGRRSAARLRPARAHARRHSSSSHIPQTLRSSRTVPSTPSSCVTLSACDARVGVAPTTSAPISAHVPSDSTSACVAIGDRRPDEGTRGVVRRHADERQPAQPRVRGRAAQRPRLVRREERRRRQAERIEHVAGPRPGAHVDHAGRRGVRRIRRQACSGGH